MKNKERIFWLLLILCPHLVGWADPVESVLSIVDGQLVCSVPFRTADGCGVGVGCEAVGDNAIQLKKSSSAAATDASEDCIRIAVAYDGDSVYLNEDTSNGGGYCHLAGVHSLTAFDVKVNSITDRAGTGAPEFFYGYSLDTVTKQLSSDAVTGALAGLLVVESESGTSDTLDTLPAGEDGQIIMVQPKAGHTITMADTGNLEISASHVLNKDKETWTARYRADDGKWTQLSIQNM
jgi:hypothetical protein